LMPLSSNGINAKRGGDHPPDRSSSTRHQSPPPGAGTGASSRLLATEVKPSTKAIHHIARQSPVLLCITTRFLFLGDDRLAERRGPSRLADFLHTTQPFKSSLLGDLCLGATANADSVPKYCLPWCKPSSARPANAPPYVPFTYSITLMIVQKSFQSRKSSAASLTRFSRVWPSNSLGWRKDKRGRGGRFLPRMGPRPRARLGRRARLVLRSGIRFADQSRNADRRVCDSSSPRFFAPLGMRISLAEAPDRRIAACAGFFCARRPLRGGLATSIISIPAKSRRLRKIYGFSISRIGGARSGPNQRRASYTPATSGDHPPEPPAFRFIFSSNVPQPHRPPCPGHRSQRLFPDSVSATATIEAGHIRATPGRGRLSEISRRPN